MLRSSGRRSSGHFPLAMRPPQILLYQFIVVHPLLFYHSVEIGSSLPSSSIAVVHRILWNHSSCSLVPHGTWQTSAFPLSFPSFAPARQSRRRLPPLPQLPLCHCQTLNQHYCHCHCHCQYSLFGESQQRCPFQQPPPQRLPHTSFPSPSFNSFTMAEAKAPEIDVQAIAKECMAWDSNAETKDTVRTWLSENNMKELTKAFSKRLQFGTAGLRGEMGPGLSRMNELTVMQASQVRCAHYCLPLLQWHSLLVLLGALLLAPAMPRCFLRAFASIYCKCLAKKQRSAALWLALTIELAAP